MAELTKQDVDILLERIADSEARIAEAEKDRDAFISRYLRENAMPSLQCGKFFVKHDVAEKFCSIECFTQAQLDSIHFCSPIHFKIYCNGEEVKRIDKPEITKTVRD